MTLRGEGEVKFRNETRVPTKQEAKYLGCRINEKGNVAKELNQRISECYLTWKKLEDYWEHADCPLREQLIIYDAIVRTKLMYGLESAHLIETLKDKIYVSKEKD